jgi:hypothetical protein
MATNTGFKKFENLELYYPDNNVSAGTTKVNVSTDPDYIAPVYDIVTCALGTVTTTVVPTIYSFTLDGYATGLYFSTNGSRLWTSGQTLQIVEYSLSTAWDIRTISFVKSYDPPGTFVMGLSFKSDGTKLYIIDGIPSTIVEISLSTPFDIGTAGTTTTYNFPNSPTVRPTRPGRLQFNSNGTKLITVDETDNMIYIYNLTSWNLSTLSLDVAYSPISQEVNPYGVGISDDGLKMMITGNNGIIYEYLLSSSWNFSSIVYSNSKALTIGGTNVSQLYKNVTLNKLYTIGQGPSTIYQYNM